MNMRHHASLLSFLATFALWKSSLFRLLNVFWWNGSFPLSLCTAPSEVIGYIKTSVLQCTSACAYMLDLLSSTNQGLLLCGAGCLWDWRLWGAVRSFAPWMALKQFCPSLAGAKLQPRLSTLRRRSHFQQSHNHLEDGLSWDTCPTWPRRKPSNACI